MFRSINNSIVFKLTVKNQINSLGVEKDVIKNESSWVKNIYQDILYFRIETNTIKWKFVPYFIMS